MLLTILFICTVSIQLPAMDRFAALSMLESGDNDKAVGAFGEVSRYQMTPSVWKKYSNVTLRPTDPIDAEIVAGYVMQDRCADYENIFGRHPNDFAWYLLWHRPAVIISHNTRHITRAELDRAKRFANLCTVNIQPGGSR